MAGAATVEKALDVLFHLHAAASPLGLAEIGRDLALPKSSCHRLLRTLSARGIVERDEAGRYQPGLALLSLGLGAQTREPLVRAARPILEAEARTLDETVFLVGRRHGVLRVLDKSEGSGFLRAAPEIGDAIPEDVTAAGQLYRVFEDASEGETFRPIRERGFATNRDAWIDGLSVLAVPVWQERVIGTREMSGVLALGCASARFAEIGEERIAGRLIEAADAIGVRLGARSGPGRR